MKIQNPQLRELFKTPKRKTYTLGGITALTVGIFIAFTIRPTFIKIADLNKEIKDKEEFLEKIENKLETVNFLISQKQSVSEDLSYFEEDLPTEEKGGFIVANLAAMAEDNNLTLVNVEFDEDLSSDFELDIENNESLTVIQVDMHLEGDAAGMENFVEDLESFPRIFDIRSINYSKLDISEYKDDLKRYKPLEFDISIYIFTWTEGQEEDEA